MCDSNGFVKRSFSPRQTKLLCETSFKNEALKIKMKLFCETSFKIEALKHKNEAFLRDFLQK